MEKQIIKSIDERLSKLEKDNVKINEQLTKDDQRLMNRAMDDHYHPAINFFLGVALAILIVLIIYLITTNYNAQPKNFYDNPNTLCEHYNMTYQQIITPVGQQNEDFCVRIVEDKITEQDLIIQVNNRWVFK